MKKNNQKNLGFTLLEMLVVMLIIIVLAAVGLRSFNASRNKSRDARRKSDLEQLQRALEMYHSDKGYYPVHTADGRLIVADGGSPLEWGQPFVDPDGSGGVYMAKLSEDPAAGHYVYRSYIRDGAIRAHGQPGDDFGATAYKIFAALENPNDPQIETDQDIIDMLENPASGPIDCGPLDCNYFVYSMNIQPTDGDWP